MLRKIGSVLLAMAMAMLISVSSYGFASGRTDRDHLHPEKRGLPPIGWLQFCAAFSADCGNASEGPDVVLLDDQSWSELVTVNRKFNREIEPVTDEDQYGLAEKWTYATTGKGDCEEYVLEKRRALISAGWPRSALLITVVLDKEGLGHAVLTVMTDRGEFILDNQTNQILRWSESGLTFLKRQSAYDEMKWENLGGYLGQPDQFTASR